MNAAAEPLWWTGEIAEITGGQTGGNRPVTGLSIDTRSLEPGDLFIAIHGEQQDGHAYVADALAKGAVAALVHAQPDGSCDDDRLIRVGDTMDALAKLGQAGRRRSRARIFAITGSVGKTGTKEALRCVCEGVGRTHASVASFNNQYGVPLSLARMPRDTEYGIFELGMNHPGELLVLSSMVRPHIALITLIAPAHMAAFDDLRGIAMAKCEVFDGLMPEGWIVLNGQSPMIDVMLEQARRHNPGQIILTGDGHDIVAHDVGSTDDNTFRISDGTQECLVSLQVSGSHWRTNALNVAGCARAAGLPMSAVAHGLAKFALPPGRGRVMPLTLPDGRRVTLIDDSYNANPASIRSALDVLSKAPGRRFAVLGEMREMGAHGEQLHRELAQPIMESGVAEAILVGDDMHVISQELGDSLSHICVSGQQDVDTHLDARLLDGDTLLIKGSNGVALGRLVARLTK